MKKTRLVLSTGCYSTLTATAIILKKNDDFENHLLLTSQKVNQYFLTTNINLAEKVWDFEKILFFNDFCQTQNPSMLDYKEIFTFNKAHYKEKTNFAEYDEIYVMHCITEDVQILVSMYPKAKVYLYDEGLASYNSIERRKIEKTLFIKSRINGTYNLEYCGKLRSFLAKDWSIKEFKIDKTCLLQTISKAQSLIDFDLSEYKKPKSILLSSQYFSYMGCMKRENEIDFYSGISKKLIEKGYTVLFKEHPRNLEPYYIDIQKQINSPNFIHFEPKTVLPLELYADKLDLLAIIGVYSTPLFSMPHLFSIPSFVFLTHEVVKFFGNTNNQNSFSAFTAELYLPSVENLLNIDIENKTNSEIRIALWEIFKRHQQNLPYNVEHPLINLKYMSDYATNHGLSNYTSLKRGVGLIKEEDLNRTIFTQEDKQLFEIVKTFNFYQYSIYKYFMKLTTPEITGDAKNVLSGKINSLILLRLSIRIAKKIYLNIKK